MSHPALGRPYNYAVSRLHAAGGDLEALPIPLRTLLMVEQAQSIIDNGGLAFFYEADFPNNPPYSAFVDAYRRIGASTAAACIEQSASLFPFAEPQYFEPLRQVWLEKLGTDPEFRRLDASICGDVLVWNVLVDYVQANRDAFAAS
jgi:hypothetical protein